MSTIKEKIIQILIKNNVLRIIAHCSKHKIYDIVVTKEVGKCPRKEGL
jgi:hypothetical protein